MAECINSKSALIAYSELTTDNFLHTSSKLLTLEYSNISQIIHHTFSQNRKFAKVPIAVLNLSIPTATRPKARDLYVEWVIQQLRTREAASSLTGVTIPSTSLSVKETPSLGIYLWPKPFLLVDRRSATEDKKPVLLWVIYGDGTSLELALFARMASSVRFLVDTKDLDRVLVSEAVKSAVKSSISRQLDDLYLTPAELPSSDIVTLETLEAYLQWTADKVNGTAENDVIVSKHTPSENHSVDAVAVDLQPNPTQTDANFDEVEEEPQPVAFVQRESSPDSPVSCNARTPSPGQRDWNSFNFQLCDIYDCQGQLSSATTTVSYWIDRKMTLDSISDMSTLVKAHLKFPSQHGIINEVEALIQILNTLRMELHNMFDNFVCFSGEENWQKMEYFIQGAKQRAKEALQSKQPQTHQSFIENLFEKCSVRIVDLVLDDNRSIYQREEKLAETVLWEILDAYQTKMESILMDQENFSPEMISMIHENLSRECKRMLEDNLELSGKLNEIQMHSVKKLEMELEACYHNLMKNYKEEEPIYKAGEYLMQQHISEYVENLSKRFDSFALKSVEERQESQNRILEQILVKVENPEHKTQVENFANIYFLYKNEMLEQQLEAQMNHNFGGLSTLCVYITTESIRVAVTTGDTHKHLLFGPNNLPDLPPILVLTTDHKFVYGWQGVETLRNSREIIQYKGGVLSYATNSVDSTVSVEMLGYFFQSLKTEAQSQSKLQSISRIMIAFPAGLTLQGRSILRKACRKADFMQIYLLDEPLLLSYTLLQNHSNCCLVIFVTKTSIDMRIFMGKPVDHVVILKATGYTSFEDFNIVNPEAIFSKIFTDMLAQVGGYLPGKINVSISCELENWEDGLYRFIVENVNFGDIVNLREESDHLLNAVIHSAGKLGNAIPKPELQGQIVSSPTYV